MLGIGYHLDKRTKQSILSQKAKEYNQIRNTLIDQGVPYQDIHKEVHRTFYQSRHKDDHDLIHPSQNSQTMNGIGGSLNLGYTNAHKLSSEARQMNERIETDFKNSKSTLKEGRTQSVQHKKQRDNDEKMKKRIYQDHIKQLTDGITFDPKSKGSQYKKQFGFTQHMQRECDSQDFTYHQRKNDLKWYSQEYAKIKTVMRK